MSARKALLLADRLTDYSRYANETQREAQLRRRKWHNDAADELRRQHAEIERLTALLDEARTALAAREAQTEAPKDWEEAYAELRDGDAFPPGTQALKVAFVAGMQWQARAALAAAPAPAPHVVGWLYQHAETGRTRVVLRDMVADCDAQWRKVGDLVLAAAPAPAPLTDEPAAALQELIAALDAKDIERSHAAMGRARVALAAIDAARAQAQKRD